MCRAIFSGRSFVTRPASVIANAVWIRRFARWDRFDNSEFLQFLVRLFCFSLKFCLQNSITYRTRWTWKACTRFATAAWWTSTPRKLCPSQMRRPRRPISNWCTRRSEVSFYGKIWRKFPTQKLFRREQAKQEHDARKAWHSRPSSTEKRRRFHEVVSRWFENGVFLTFYKFFKFTSKPFCLGRYANEN